MTVIRQINSAHVLLIFAAVTAPLEAYQHHRAHSDIEAAKARACTSMREDAISVNAVPAVCLDAPGVWHDFGPDERGLN